MVTKKLFIGQIILLLLLSPYTLMAKEKRVFDESKRAVTHRTSGGRFGDKLLGYAHAKWISYKYGIPLLYRPFIYSDQLALHTIETRYHSADAKRFRLIIQPQRNIDYTKSISALYILPYFPDCPWEIERGKSYHFPVDWNDPEFRQILRECIAPIEAYPHIQLSEQRKNVAIHYREGGGYDSKKAQDLLPLKHPPFSYYLEQLKTLYERLDQPLFVYIFTDAKDPGKWVELFEKEFAEMDILFNSRREGNRYDAHVLEDFFEMARFECLIRPESNFSIMASKLGKYDIQIKPTRFRWVDGTIHIVETEVEIAIPTLDGDRHLKRTRINHDL